MSAYLDANVLLRHLLEDHEQHSPRATALFSRIEGGKLDVAMADTAIFETVFTLERSYGWPKAEVADALAGLLSMPSLKVDFAVRLEIAFDLYARLNLPFGDAYIAAASLTTATPEVLSFDRDFDRIPGISRVEP